MQLASHDSNAGANDITGLKQSCLTSLVSGAIDNTSGITKICLDP